MGPRRPGTGKLRQLKRGGNIATECSHTGQAQIFETKIRVCEDCVKTGDRWVHLRLCLTCGHVGCCDSSKNMHATRHFRETGHPLVRSIEPGERWVWCYADELAPGEIVKSQFHSA